MEFVCTSGSTFRLSGHLWGILTEPFGNPPSVIVTLLTSLKTHSDTAVILVSGDHDDLKR